MLPIRILSALVFIPITVAVVWAGGAFFALVMMFVALISGLEYSQALRQGGFKPFVALLLAFNVGNVALVGVWLLPTDLSAHAIAQAAVPAPLLMLFLTLGMVRLVMRYGDGDDNALINFGLSLVGGVYLGLFSGYVLAIRALPNGQLWALLVILATGLGDAGAYFTGRALGKRKFAPVVSPSKTWEGYWGGAITATIVGAGFAHWVNLGLAQGLLVGVVVGIVSPLGDLGMSAIKRICGQKHFGWLIPGHGGVLDRIDSLLFVMPLSFYLILLLVGG
jgi:phosphatidate cytidylyltransferase